MFVDPSGLSGIRPDGSYYITHPSDQKLLELKQEYGNASAERQAQIAIEAQNIRNNGVENVDWSVHADKPLDYYIISDITNKLNNYMSNKARKYAYLRNESLTCRLRTFKKLVGNKCEMDLKNKADWQHEHFIYNGEIIDKDVPGNINYGYFGASINILTSVLHVGAGYAQVCAGTAQLRDIMTLFDDPRDYERINQGIKLYYSTLQPEPGPIPTK